MSYIDYYIVASYVKNYCLPIVNASVNAYIYAIVYLTFV